MENLSFFQVLPGDRRRYGDAEKLWIPFCRELASHQGVEKSDGEIAENLRKRVAIQGKRPDMHLEIAYAGCEPVGISNFAIDLGTVYGLLEAGYGTVMGFTIVPAFRRRGFGREFYGHIEETLRHDGARRIYVCPDPVTGLPFWKAMGFIDSGKTDPDERLPIYIRSITPSGGCRLFTAREAGKAEAGDVGRFYRENLAALHGISIPDEKWREILSVDDTDERNFLICRGGLPFAWLRVNGLLDQTAAWISMLAVGAGLQRRGAGAFSVRYAEELARMAGKRLLRVRTTEDNAAARALYLSCGFTVRERGESIYGDGVPRATLVFEKML